LQEAYETLNEEPKTEAVSAMARALARADVARIVAGNLMFDMDVGQNGRPMWDHRCYIV